MRCENCGSESHHIIVTANNEEICHVCGSFSEAGGTRTEGLLTRNRFSVRRDSIMNEGDTLPPHEYDKHERKFKPREDFIKRFPDRVGETFSQKELDKSGYNKLKVNKPKPKKESDVIEIT